MAQMSLEDKIVQLNPLLESYGNAQTLRNDNSSRFGKFIELRFNEKHTIEGALMYEYLLEKSRVIGQSTGERNFHVFYLFFAGKTAEEKTKYKIGDPARHRFICGNPEAISDINGPKYKGMAQELNECIAGVGFTDSEIDHMNCLLAAILHMGDLVRQISVVGCDSNFILLRNTTAMRKQRLPSLPIRLPRSSIFSAWTTIS